MKNMCMIDARRNQATKKPRAFSVLVSPPNVVKRGA